MLPMLRRDAAFHLRTLIYRCLPMLRRDAAFHLRTLIYRCLPMLRRYAAFHLRTLIYRYCAAMRLLLCELGFTDVAPRCGFFEACGNAGRHDISVTYQRNQRIRNALGMTYRYKLGMRYRYQNRHEVSMTG